MKIILTGGAGFIGSVILWKLNQINQTDIIVVDRLKSDMKWKNLTGKRFYDYIDKDDFLQLVKEKKCPVVDFIIHMGACSSTTYTDAYYYMKNNYEYTRILAEYCIDRKIPFLYASSAATYGDGENGFSDDDTVTLKLKPMNIYGFSKHLFDMWVLKNFKKGKFIGFKFFNVFGPNEYHKGDMRSLLCKKFKDIVKEKKIKLFKSYRKNIPDGEQKRDFIYVKDAVDAVLFFLQHPDKTGIYNIGTGKANSWNDLARATLKALGLPENIEYIDMPDELKDKYQYFTEADISKLLKTGFNGYKYNLETAVKEYVEFLKNDAYL